MSAQFLEDARRNRLPASVYPPPEGFKLRRIFSLWLFDEYGYRLPVLLRPTDTWEEMDSIADELCQRHGWRRA